MAPASDLGLPPSFCAFVPLELLQLGARASSIMTVEIESRRHMTRAYLSPRFSARRTRDATSALTGDHIE
jgi:hypothetical protein